MASSKKSQIIKVLDQVVTDRYSLYHGDSCEVIKGMPDNSLDYMITSPPFASLYCYSNSDRDMGNCSGGEAFSTHFQFLINELFRTIKPGRLVSFHCMDLPASLTHDGFIGLKDFPGELTRMFQDAGFIKHSEVCIWKDPVTAMQRTKAIGLLHKTIKKDSSMSRQGVPDLLITMRKPGKNEEPIAGRITAYHGDDEMLALDLGMTQGDLPNGEPFWFVDGVATDRHSIDVWQRYASPVWMDVNPSDTLQRQSARDSEDERHICPLQLTVIRRGLQLWSNPGDVVLDPFNGIGSTGHVCMEHGRKYVGIELKKSYYEVATRNLATAANQPVQQSLF
jgi:hypothetical protein